MVGSFTFYLHHDRNSRSKQKFVTSTRHHFNPKGSIYIFKFCMRWNILTYYWLIWITLILLLLLDNSWSLSEQSSYSATTTTVPKSSPIRHNNHHHDPIISNNNSSTTTTRINSSVTDLQLDNIVFENVIESNISHNVKSKSRKKKNKKIKTNKKKKKKIILKQRHKHLSNHVDDEEKIDKRFLSNDIQSDVSRQSNNKKQTNLIINDSYDIQNNTGKKKMIIKKSSSVLKKQSTIHQMTAMRRIQREWKDIIDAGIAFDWVNGRPQQSKRMKRQNNYVQQNTAKTIRNNTTSYVWLGPLSKQYWWIWHFTFIGLPGSVYENGIYHGRIQINPKNYPLTPPSIQIYTQSGRFICHYDICLLTASNYHPELWQPSSWTIRTIVEAVRLHMITLPNEIGGINDSYEKRLYYANKSRSYQKRIVINSGKSTTNKNRKSTNNSSSTKVTITIDHHKMIENGWITSANDESSSTSLLNDNENVNSIHSEHNNVILNDEQRSLEKENDIEEIHTNSSSTSSYLQYITNSENEIEVKESFMINDTKSIQSLSKNETIRETTINNVFMMNDNSPSKKAIFLPSSSSKSSLHKLNNKRVIKKKSKSIQQYYESSISNNDNSTTTTNEIRVNEYYESNHHKSNVVVSRHHNVYTTTISKTNHNNIQQQQQVHKRKQNNHNKNKTKISLSISSFISVLSYQLQKVIYTIVIALLCWYLLKPIMY